jgi:hypothetical protein
MNPNASTTLRDLVVDSLAILAFFLLVVLHDAAGHSLLSVTAAVPLIMSVVGGRLTLRALVSRPGTEPAAPVPAEATAAASSSSSSTTPPTSGVVFLLFGLGHLLATLAKGRGA